MLQFEDTNLIGNLHALSRRCIVAASDQDQTLVALATCNTIHVFHHLENRFHPCAQINGEATPLALISTRSQRKHKIEAAPGDSTQVG
ncbi:hypothetical protein BdWA1_003005 [Babesia duncani]|uniref:Uncharacterized protein n=1 Tax=Babesia duncani TaxID=323732 RepID=A0AAD9PIJ5_9APIC|nr:hypothetical protein BdWA1_003005 [Babesia duncani]